MQLGSRILVALFTMCCAIAVHAQVHPIEWNENTSSLVDFQMEYFVDGSEVMPISEVVKQPFIESTNKISLGTKAIKTWARINIQNTSAHSQTVFLHHPYAYHNRQVGLYEVVDNRILPPRRLDLDDPDTFQWMYGGAAVFNIELLPGQNKTLYLDSVSFSHQWFSINLYNSEFSQRALIGSFTDIALLVGMLLALIIYNLLLFIYSRQKENLFYACYLISGAIWIALSYGLFAEVFHFFGSKTLHWHLTLMTMPIFLILFMMAIFETRKQYPKEHLALMLVLILLCIEFCYGMIDIVAALRYSSSLAALMMLITLSVSISLVVKRHPVAWYFLIGHSLFIGFNALAVLYYQGRIEFNYVTSHGVGIGIMLEALVLALIIAYRIRLLEEIKASQEELKQQASTDPLTQLYNRRHFHLTAGREYAHALLSHEPMSVIICDIDWFKQINDQYGHTVGDKVIVEVANTLKKVARKRDIAARYGGEEYILLLPNTDIVEARICAERIRREVAELKPFETDEQRLSVTISLGVAAVSLKQPLEKSIKLADDALYRAKSSGRNQVNVMDTNVLAHS
ncbi:GGDEF domain-containing protein [Vibrio ziniensis]|uniref:diguanylate cyclase n=1 Tax=Vibrio ziniensis TaxID=2711221 RepID=A0A6G7CLQ3_9VIBR|nr:GGDEF domain-containing protein [Vibrio ziniensis]QIH43032.1 GGDEF domain-containing protein [Vibrio ziniensis]